MRDWILISYNFGNAAIVINRIFVPCMINEEILEEDEAWKGDSSNCCDRYHE